MALETIGVLGAGAMGAGIAQVAALRAHPVVLSDVSAAQAEKGRDDIGAALAREVQKGRLTNEEREAALSRIVVAPGDGTGAAYAAFTPCALVIEAIVENLEVKRAAFAAIERIVAGDAVLATNTSSLSITSIASACLRPERVLGVHFFNPAAIMPLVEIIPGVLTSPAVLDSTRALVLSWNKTTVLCADTPGFIVNRIARPFYGEALRILEEGEADIATIDWAMKEIGGFRMGPFELMDFIGHDVNYVVTESVWRAMYFDGRYKPSLTQKRLLEAGLLGRKSGRGFYDRAPGAVSPEPHRERAHGEAIVSRILAMLVNEAVDAVFQRVASPEDIELAMTKGVNYPKGLLAWGSEIGLPVILERLEALHAEFGEERYRPSPLLKRMVQRGTTFAR